MVSVQLMCGRLGLVTGRGLAAIICDRYPRWILWGACALLVTANVANIGADLGGMGEAAELVSGVPSLVWAPVFGLLMIAVLFWSSYHVIARVFKWLTLVLFAYVATAWVAHVDWKAALLATVIPRMQWSRDSMAVFVAILGTTISPYLFFWQAAQEVEQEHDEGRDPEGTPGVTAPQIQRLRIDTITGMTASNVIMYFIILTTAATLHSHGLTHIETAKQAAEALRPPSPATRPIGSSRSD